MREPTGVAGHLGVRFRRPRHPGPQRPDGRRPKNAAKLQQTTLHRRQNSQCREPSIHLLRTVMSTSSGDELKLGHFHCHNHLCKITGTSITVDELRHVIDHTAPVVAHNGHATTGPEFNELQLWELGCLLTDCTRTCWTSQPGRRSPYQ